MGLFSRVFYGVDLDEEQKRQDELDAKLRDLNAKRREQGKYDQKTFEEAEANRKKSYIEDVDQEVDDAFWEGFDDGANNIRHGVGSTINTAIGTPLKLIPWQLWLAGAVWGAWKLGLLKGVLGRFKS